MNEIERETLRLMKIMNNTLENINLKMNKITFDPLYSSDSDPGSDSEPEEPEELEEAFKKSFKSLVEK